VHLLTSSALALALALAVVAAAAAAAAATAAALVLSVSLSMEGTGKFVLYERGYDCALFTCVTFSANPVSYTNGAIGVVCVSFADTC